jgi:hypothetical protein
MSRRITFLIFILVNIVVSATVTLLVLTLWERAHPLPVVPASAAGPGALPVNPQGTPVELTSGQDSAGTAVAGTVVPTLDPAQAGDVIRSVMAPGDLENEAVLLANLHDAELVLTNWQLKDSQGNTFTFPAFALNKDGTIQIHTKAGSNKALNLFWGRDAAAWRQGDTVTLLDDQGNPRATYLIP